MRKGLASVFYLDDILIIGKSYEICVDNIQKISRLLQKLGFISNKKKSLTVPTQRCKYLGLIFDSKKMSIELPEDKIERTIELLNKFRKTLCCKIREFAAFVGTLMFQCPALKYGMIHVRRFERAHALEENSNNYNAVMTLPKI